MPSGTLDDLNLTLFQQEYLPSTLPSDILEENQRTVEHQLASVRFISTLPSIQPTNLGILVVGKDPNDVLTFNFCEGTELPIKDQKEIAGQLPLMMLRVLDEILQSHISIASGSSAQWKSSSQITR